MVRLISICYYTHKIAIKRFSYNTEPEIYFYFMKFLP
jgi:hypothetical protein